MENQDKNEYGQTNPDIIDQNTLIDGTNLHEEEVQKQQLTNNENEFGESDPDHIDQNTLVDNDNSARDEDPYQYQEEFVEDLDHPENDFENRKGRKPGDSDDELDLDNEKLHRD